MSSEPKLPSYLNLVSKLAPVVDVDEDGDLTLTVEFPATKQHSSSHLYILANEKFSVGSTTEKREVFIQLNQTSSTPSLTPYISTSGSETKYDYALEGELGELVHLEPIRIILEEGALKECPIVAGDITLSELEISKDSDGDIELEGVVRGPKGFIYGFEVSADKSGNADELWFDKIDAKDDRAGILKYLTDAKIGDEVFLLLGHAKPLDAPISIVFNGEAGNSSSETLNQSFETDETGPAGNGGELTQDGSIGLFEFQIKRGVVDVDGIDQDEHELHSLVSALVEACDAGDNETAANLLLQNLQFEFDPAQMDDDPEMYFADTSVIEFECTSDVCSVQVSSKGGLSVTISVTFEIPISAGISIGSLEDYIADGGAWAAGHVSPGWGYTGSDGDNLRLIEVR